MKKKQHIVVQLVKKSKNIYEDKLALEDIYDDRNKQARQSYEEGWADMTIAILSAVSIFNLHFTCKIYWL